MRKNETKIKSLERKLKILEGKCTDLENQNHRLEEELKEKSATLEKVTDTSLKLFVQTEKLRVFKDNILEICRTNTCGNDSLYIRKIRDKATTLARGLND
jgi:chromosome segregation ATPase